MFDIGASELLLIVVVAIVVIGPKDLPRALRTAGQWIAKIRRVSGHFRSGIETMIREAELEEMERKWREQNEAIMKAHPQLPEPQSSPEPSQIAPETAASPVKGVESRTEEVSPQLPLSHP
jgi:sec-independent protein translocase protein TatB